MIEDPPGEDVFKTIALSNTNDPKILVASFIMRFDSQDSRVGMTSSLRIVADLAQPGCPLEAFPWWQLRREHCQLLRAKLAEKYAPASARRHLAALRGVLREAWRMKLMSTDDYQRAVDIGSVKGSRLTKGHRLTPDQVERMYEVVAQRYDSPMKERHTVLLSIAMNCGLRVMEICDADLEWVSHSTLNVLGKGNKEREVPLNERVLADLGVWFKLRGVEPGPILCGFDAGGKLLLDRRMNRSTVSKSLNEIAAEAEIEQFSPHDTRRTFITNLLLAGVDVMTVMKLAGHDDIKTTMLYDQRGEIEAREAVNRIGMSGMGLSTVRAATDLCVCHHPVKRHRDSAPSPCRIKGCLCGAFKLQGERKP